MSAPTASWGAARRAARATAPSIYCSRAAAASPGSVSSPSRGRYANGRPARESTGAEKEAEARGFLKAREGRVATGQPIPPRADRVRYAEVAQDLRQYYQATGTRDLVEAEYRLTHLGRCFDGRRVASIGHADITSYVVRRQGQGAANGTINRELATLSRMLRLAYKNGETAATAPP